MPPKKTLTDYFSGGASSRADAKLSSSSSSSSSSSMVISKPTQQQGLTVDSRELPEILVSLMASHPEPVHRMAWPIPGVLGMGSSPTDKSEPETWMRDESVRVVVDVSADDAGIRARGQLKTACTGVGALLITLPINSRLEMGFRDREVVVRVCRVLQACVGHMVAAQAAGEACAGKMYLCDSRGGGVAALVAVLMICAQYRVDYDLARIYVTRCWREKTIQLNNIRQIKMFPEGDSLRTAGGHIAARLRQKPIVSETKNSSASDEMFQRHGVLHMGRAMLGVCGVGSDALPPYRIPFRCSSPFAVVVWLMRTSHEQLEQDTHERSSIQSGSKWRRNRDDDDDDDEQARWQHRRRARGRREDDDDDDDDDESD